MNRLQKWFEVLAGISYEEQARLARAHEIFANAGPNLEMLELPACWRRKALIAAGKKAF